MSLPKLIEKLAELMKQKGNSLANNTLYEIFITFGKKKKKKDVKLRREGREKKEPATKIISCITL